MTRHTHKTRQKFPFQRAVLGVLLVLLIANFYLITAQLVTWHSIAGGTPVNQAAPELPCTASDIQYCALIRRLIPAVETSDFSQLLANQAVTAVICPSPAAAQYCSNAAAGTTLSLFTIYVAGQPKPMMRNDYIASLRAYKGRVGKLSYVAPKSGLQNPLLFRDARGVVSLELQLEQTASAGWEFAWPIVIE
jgi:hypothetical protein